MLLFGWSEGMYILVSGNCNYGVNTPANTSVFQLKGLHNTSLLEIIFSDYLELLSPPHLMSFSLPCRADLSWTKVKDSPRHPLCMTLCHLVLPLLTLRKLRPLPPPGTSLPEDWVEHSADSQAVLNLPESSIVGIRVYFDWGGQVHEEEGHWEHQPCTFCHKEVHAPPSQSK